LTLLLTGAAIAGVTTFLGAWYAEHQRAERQREQKELVRVVFQDILSAAAPQRMGGDVRLLEVLEVAARSIDDSLRDAPDVQAAMELTIGDTYRRLLRANEAVPHLRRALERYRKVDDRRELEVARCANVLGLALADQNSAESIPVLEEALAIRARELGDAHVLVAESRRSLAIGLLSQFTDVDGTRASELLDRAAASFRVARGEDDAELAETKLWQARAIEYTDSGRAGKLLREALHTFEQRAPDDPRTISALNTCASWAQEQGEFEEARAMLERSAVLARKLFGDLLATDIIRRSARLSFARGDFATAERMSRQAVAQELVRWSARRPEESARLRSLARRVEEPGSPAAEPPYAEAFATLRTLEGDGSFELAQWMNGIAATLVELKRGAAIEPILRQALAIRCRAMGADCPVRQRTIELLATELIAEGRGEEALPVLAESLATFERLGQSETPAAASTAELMSACHPR
jgi:tetratricopeptide (TPR) repeat protein